MENEKRLIDANTFCIPKGFFNDGINVPKILDLVAKQPTVDAVEVVHGRWIEKIDIVESYLADCIEVFYECSVCECANIGESPYCPNCGAKMDGGNEDV